MGQDTQLVDSVIFCEVLPGGQSEHGMKPSILNWPAWHATGSAHEILPADDVICPVSHCAHELLPNTPVYVFKGHKEQVFIPSLPV